MMRSLLKTLKLTVAHPNGPVLKTPNPTTYGLEKKTLKVGTAKPKSRNARRVPYRVCTFLVGKWGLGDRTLTALEDLSTTGCCVISDSPLQIGSEWGLSFVASWSERDITIEAATVRWADGNRYGLEFLAIDPTERERLRLYLKSLVDSPASTPEKQIEAFNASA